MTTQKYLSAAMSAEAIVKACASIKTKGKALDTLTHNVAVAVLIQSLPHALGGHLDCSKGATLIGSMTEGQSRRRVIAWFDAFTNVRLTMSKTTDKATKVETMAVKATMLKPGEVGYRELDEGMVETAIAMPFYLLNQEREPVPVLLDDAAFAKALQSIVARFNPPADKARENVTIALSPKAQQILAQVTKEAATAAARAEALAKAAAPKPARKAA